MKKKHIKNEIRKAVFFNQQIQCSDRFHNVYRKQRLSLTF